MVEQMTELERNAVELKNRLAKEEFIYAVDSQWINNRMAGAAMNRCLGLIQQELKIEKDNQEKTDHAAMVDTRAAREIALAREIELEKRRVYSDTAHRQCLRENDPQLKTLRKKLTAGYVCRYQRKQIQDHEYRRLQEKAEEKYNNTIFYKAMAKDHEIEAREMQEDFMKKTKYRMEILNQIQNNQGIKAYELKVKEADKILMDQLMKALEDEKTQAEEKKRESKSRQWCEMLTCLESREAWKRDRRLDQVDLMERVRREQAEADLKKSNLKAESDARKAAKEAVVGALAERNLAAAKAEEAIVEQVRELREQEEYRRGADLEQAEQRKEVIMKIDNKMGLEQQMRMRGQDRERERRMDEFYRNQLLERMVKDDEQERVRVEKHKAKIKNYAAELKIQIEANAKTRQKEKEEMDERNKYALSGGGNEKVAAVIEERHKMIEEHAPHVLGYLQAGVLQHEDLPFVRRGADKHPHLKHLDIEAMGRGAGRAHSPSTIPNVGY